MSDHDSLMKKMEEWGRSLDSAMPEARTSFLAYMTALGFTHEQRDIGGSPLTIFRYVGEDGVSVFCGDWMATLTHVFTRQNWPLTEPFRVSNTTVRTTGVWTAAPPSQQD